MSRVALRARTRPCGYPGRANSGLGGMTTTVSISYQRGVIGWQAKKRSFRCACHFGRRWRLSRWKEKACCGPRSEEHTSELQSRENLVCRLLLEKKKNRG